ncbi:MAG: phospho-N-acetylmuramoyl-pentapeptide-transferase [Armatimonadaceae bacterium]
MNPYALMVIPFLVALTAVLAAGPAVIAALAARKAKQPISPDAPEKHRLKHGTPTMGGLLLIGGTLLAVLAVVTWLGALGILNFARMSRLLAVLLVFLFAGLIGILDDVGKARKKENKAGLSEKAKLSLQFLVAGGFIVYLLMFPQEQNGIPITTSLWLFGNRLDLGWLYYAFAALYIAFFANAVNFSDGLDGLASGTTLIPAVALGAAALTPPALGLEVAIFYGAVAGACAGFLWFNVYPARVFMGDTGSLALGMGMAAAALAAKQEILFLLVGLVYVAEIGSMMIQRYVFKYRRIKHGIEYAKANRVFRRAPLHHHFEELGWHETQVVGRFWVAALIFAALGLLLSPLVTPEFYKEAASVGGQP